MVTALATTSRAASTGLDLCSFRRRNVLLPRVSGRASAGHVKETQGRMVRDRFLARCRPVAVDAIDSRGTVACGHRGEMARCTQRRASTGTTTCHAHGREGGAAGAVPALALEVVAHGITGR